VVCRPQLMPTDAEEILHDAVNRREALQLGGGLEAPHLPLTLSRRLMRHLGPVVRVLIGAVNHRRHHRTVCSRVAAELVRDQAARDTSIAFQQLPEDSERRAPIPSRLHKDIADPLPGIAST